MVLCLRHGRYKNRIPASERFSRITTAGAVGFCDFAAAAEAVAEDRSRRCVGGCGVSDIGAVSRTDDGNLATTGFALGSRDCPAAAEDAVLPEDASAARR